MKKRKIKRELSSLTLKVSGLHQKITNQDGAIIAIHKKVKSKNRIVLEIKQFLKNHMKEEMEAHLANAAAVQKVETCLTEKIGDAMGEVKALKMNDRWVNGLLLVIIGSLAYFK